MPKSQKEQTRLQMHAGMQDVVLKHYFQSPAGDEVKAESEKQKAVIIPDVAEPVGEIDWSKYKK